MWCSALPLLLVVSTAVVALQPEAQGEWLCGHQEAHKRPFCSWKCMIFTLQWPATFCQSLSNASQCHIPSNVTGWTIHGLWPEHVTNCCRCWPMFPSDVANLQAELSESWPSFLKKRSSFQFWHMEWQKHGTCAACVEGLNSPQKYFQLSVQLRQRFDILRLLEAAGITPSCQQSYKVADLKQVLDPLLGAQYKIQCVTSPEGKELWFQLEISLSRNLQLGCNAQDQQEDQQGYHQGYQWGAPAPPRHPCNVTTPIYYMPIVPEHPERPCS